MTVKVSKKDLIQKIQDNRQKHVQEYEQAVKDYREEADKQLRRLRRDLNAGKVNLELKMVSPINRAAEYDKLINMFSWETGETVELAQGEFNKLVSDEWDISLHARIANFAYSKGK